MTEREPREPRSSPRRARGDAVSLDTPREARRQLLSRPQVDPDAFGRASEKFARFMGTARFLVYMTGFVAVWLAWNTFAPEGAQFDPRALNYTLLTLILSLQASYAAPLILLAQNRQDDRDRVLNEQDRAQGERALADTEYLTREVAALRIALRDVATRDFVRSELRAVLEELRDEDDVPAPSRDAKRKGGKKRKRPPEPAAGAERPAEPAPTGSTPAEELPMTDG
ncbi:putative membrane protein [Kineococcus radiotolerans]|uniref:Putative membrane protein n=1 Tax=Kineococcus radiotolerans TaxID=131568 RepID=A0A7W4XW85_KINRA|nr:DUF1003 domain-containing protein [Kineococcus radiotolerans]MBB2900167.1 putative membrane protein [Kineococcus radiotolerans]